MWHDTTWHNKKLLPFWTLLFWFINRAPLISTSIYLICFGNIWFYGYKSWECSKVLNISSNFHDGNWDENTNWKPFNLRFLLYDWYERISIQTLCKLTANQRKFTTKNSLNIYYWINKHQIQNLMVTNVKSE